MKILFADKVMAGICREPPRGVELFNIRLLGELTGLGVDVTALIHPSWQAYLAGKGITFLFPDEHQAREQMGAGQMLRLVAGQSYDVLLLGNVANRLVGLVLGARLRRVCRNCVVIAHREPSRRVLWAQRVWPRSVIVAVNAQIAGHYARAGFSHVAVYYGITGASAYRRPPDGDTAKAFVDFCVVGNLGNAWKGADTAIAAFRGLPDAIRSRCRLHLASYHTVPGFPEQNIIAYPWMASEAMPKFLAGMDVMLVPSRDEKVMRETFSQVMVQGMLCELPVICTDLPILTEKLDQGGGIIASDIQAMTDGMERLAADAALRRRLGGQARATALARYIWDTNRFITLFLASANCQ